MARTFGTVLRKYGGVKAKPKTRVNGYGVTKVVRDSYGPTWFTIRAEVLERDGRKCRHVLLDGRICSSTNRLDVHHIRPLSKGGLTVKSNLITLCEEHHMMRHKHMTVAPRRSKLRF